MADHIRPICLASQSALAAWRAIREGRMPMPEQREMSVLAACTSSTKAFDEATQRFLGVYPAGTGFLPLLRLERRPQRESILEPPHEALIPRGLSIPTDGPSPLHLAVSDRAQVHAARGIRTHMIQQNLPEPTIYGWNEHLLIVGPELAFAQSCLGDRALPNIELANELCGTYALAPQGWPCIYDAQPLFSASSLKAYLANLRRCKGKGVAMMAASLAQDGLGSPRECELLLLLVLPPDLGGYGLPRPVANAKIPLVGTPFERSYPDAFLRADLLWEALKIVVEYDGYDDHERTSEQVAHDKERRTVLAALGYRVIVVTKRDCCNVRTLRNKVEQIAVAIGESIPVFAGEQLRTHEALVRWLLSAKHDHLPFGCGYR